MTCEDVKRGMELPLDWHTPDELREMWQHMSGCRTCNERYGWQFQLWWLMRDAMEEPPPGLADRIMLEVRAQKQPVVRRLPWWNRGRRVKMSPFPGMATATGLLLSLKMTCLPGRGPGGPMPPPSIR